MKAMTVLVLNQPTVVTGDNPHYLANCLGFHLRLVNDFRRYKFVEAM